MATAVIGRACIAFAVNPCYAATPRRARLLDDIMDSLDRPGPPITAEHPIPAEDARQAEIVLRRRWEHIVFIAGLAAAVLLTAAMIFSFY